MAAGAAAVDHEREVAGAELFDLPPGAPDLLLRLGDLYRNSLGRMDDAREAYAVARARRPDHLPTLERLAKTYPKEGKTDAVVAREHHDIVRVAPRATDSYYLLYQAHRRAGARRCAW